MVKILECTEYTSVEKKTGLSTCAVNSNKMILKKINLCILSLIEK